MAVSKRDIVAIYKAIKVLENTGDALRVERAQLSLAKTFTEAQAGRMTGYLEAAMAPAQA